MPSPLAEHILEQREIKPTALRLLILQAMMQAGCAVSLTDLETKLGTVDKSTIYRTLTLFLSHHLVHQVEDGSGHTKYALCAEQCHCGEDRHRSLRDLHPHFYCECCQRTFCFRDQHIPAVDIPEGFHLHSANYVLKGICPECRRKADADCRAWDAQHHT